MERSESPGSARPHFFGFNFDGLVGEFGVFAESSLGLAWFFFPLEFFPARRIRGELLRSADCGRRCHKVSICADRAGDGRLLDASLHEHGPELPTT